MNVSLDWKQLLDQYHVEYRTDGPNCAKGHVVVKCPFCGPSDPSEHMGIELSTGAWGCWRSSTHRGRQPHRLLAALLKISYARVDALIGKGRVTPDLESFGSRINNLFAAPHDVVDSATQLAPLKEFMPLSSGAYSSARFVRYLESRGFPVNRISELVDDYGLWYAVSGVYKDRVIFPITYDGDLVGWTGRSIHADAEIRYLTLSPNRGEPTALKNVKHCLWNEAGLTQGGTALVVTEGPFDALKIDFFARSFGVRASSLFSAAMLPEQAGLLREFSWRFDRLLIMLDSDAVSQSMKIASEIEDLHPTRVLLPDGVKDPGAMTEQQIHTLFANLVGDTANRIAP